jgi:cytidylate kinase
VGSGQRVVRKYLDELIWIDISAQVGLQRVLQRDGKSIEKEMEIWQMRENYHFVADNTRDSSTIRIDGATFI